MSSHSSGPAGDTGEGPDTQELTQIIMDWVILGQILIFSLLFVNGEWFIKKNQRWVFNDKTRTHAFIKTKLTIDIDNYVFLNQKRVYIENSYSSMLTNRDLQKRNEAAQAIRKLEIVNIFSKYLKFMEVIQYVSLLFRLFPFLPVKFWFGVQQEQYYTEEHVHWCTNHCIKKAGN